MDKYFKKRFSKTDVDTDAKVSKTIIDELADELLLHILQFCDAKSIKSAAFVCVRWNNLIGTSAIIMKKFFLNLREENPRFKLEPNFQSRRFHYNVFLDRHCQILVPNLSKARFIKYHSKDSAEMNEDFVAFLSETKFLETLQISCDSFPTDVKFQMKLKALKLERGISNVLDFVDAEHLIELDVSTACDNFNGDKNESIASLTKFLDRAENLKILTICLFDLLEYFTTTKKSIIFKLTRLNLSCRGCKPKTNHSLLMQTECEALMTTQEWSLTHLSLDFIPDFMFRIVVKNLKTLENLKISRFMFDWSKESKLFYEEHIMSTLKSLTCDDSLYSDIDVEALLGLFPNVEDLTVCYLSLANWRYMAMNNPNLKSLNLFCILSLDGDNGVELSKSSLETLHVQQLYNSQYLLAFLKRCSAIKSLEIDSIQDSNFPSNVKKIVHSSLKVLKIGGDIDYITGTFDKLKNDFGNLDTLIIKSNTWDNSSKNVFLRFDFPSDKSQWNVKKAEGKFSKFAMDFLQKS